MLVQKRNGSSEQVSFDKIMTRIQKLCWAINARPTHKGNRPQYGLGVDVSKIVASVCSSVVDGIPTAKIDELTADKSASMVTEHPNYGILAARISISNLHKQTTDNILATYTKMADLLSGEFMDNVRNNCDAYESFVNYDNDYDFDYFGFKTVEKMYLTRVNGVIVERPQHVYLRVAIALWGDDIDKVRETYEALSAHKFTHASPTLFNAGLKNSNLASCFLSKVGDSMKEIYEALGECAQMSKHGGGVGLHITNIRGAGSKIKGTNGTSDGIVPMLKVFDATASYSNQCFTPDARVFVRRCGYTTVDRVIEGDSMLTNDGNWKRVNHVVRNNAIERDVITIKVSGSVFPITTTPVHEIYVLRDGNPNPSFINAGDIRTGDMLGFPIPRQTVDVNYTQEFFMFYGLMLANGIYLSDSNEFSFPHGLQESSSEYIQTFLENHNVQYRVVHGSNKSSIRWSDDDFPLRGLMYGDSVNECDKMICPSFWNIPRHKSSILLRGIVGDLNYFETFFGKDMRANSFETVSEKLMMGIRYIFLRHGILISGVFNNGAYSIVHDITEERMVDNELMLFTPVVSLTHNRYTGTLYDFNMADNHNYLTDIGLVHNSGKRKGSFAVYIEPWHPDIMDFLMMRRNQGEESLRARDLFYAMWVNDIFMRRVEADAEWSLFDPSEHPQLSETFGEEFEALYETLETTGKSKKTVRARDVWNMMVTTQIETGMPYVLNKDEVNRKNMQANAGIISGSNLCSEVIEYTSKDEIAVCVIGSVVLKNHVKNGAFDFQDLRKSVKILAKNLDKSIDVMSYPIEKAKTSNMRRRPIGVGVQGLQDVFFKLRLPFASEEAMTLNRRIFEHIYYAAVEASVELAELYGPHPTFEGSPASKGMLQYKLWGVEPRETLDWKSLEERVIKTGVCNSLHVALMPTASTAQICGSVEACEPIASNIFSRRTIAGEFPMINSYLIRDLIARGTWTEAIKNQIIAHGGSIQKVIGIERDIKELYKTVWEISMKTLIDMAAERGPYVDQTQSMNLFLMNPSLKSVSSMLFYAWKKGLKTILYYLRSRPSANAIKVTVDTCLACAG